MDAVVRSVAHLPERVVESGSVLIREGDPHGALFVLIDGIVAVFKGDMRVARIRTPGALFGEMSTLLQMPCSATVVADGPARVKMVPDGEAFLLSSPEVVLHTARVLAQRLHDSTSYLADMKTQFQDKSDHFGMVDQIMGALMNEQPESPAQSAAVKSDPRL